MSSEVFKRRQAQQDIEDVAAFIAEHNRNAARRFVIAVDETFNRLAGMPRIGVVHTTGNPDLAGLRRFPVPGFRNYLIFYRPADDGIDVVRVIHGARDYPRLFGD